MKPKCIEFKGYCDKRQGYGRKAVNGKPILAHRLAWTEANGEIPEGMQVLHKCDNPPCINVDHLFLGTNADNMRDKAKKGRGVTPGLSGEQHYNSKLTAQQVTEIRKKYIPYKVTYKMLAKEYGVHLNTIHELINNKTWREVG